MRKLAMIAALSTATVFPALAWRIHAEINKPPINVYLAKNGDILRVEAAVNP